MLDRIRTYDLRIRSPLLYPVNQRTLLPLPEREVLEGGLPFFILGVFRDPFIILLTCFDCDELDIIQIL